MTHKKRYRKTFTIPQLNAGDAGFWEITNVGFTGVEPITQIQTGQIGKLKGLQMTVVYASAGSVYITYYAPNATDSAITAAIIVEE